MNLNAHTCVRRALLLAVVVLFFACRGDSEEHYEGLWFGGDMHWGDQVDNKLLDVIPVVDGRLGFINLEGPIVAPDTLTTPEDNRLRLFNAPEGLSYLHSARAKMVSIANNHQADYGQDGWASTQEHISVADLNAVGGEAGIIVKTVSDVEVGFVGYHLTEDLIPHLRESIARAAERCEILVCSFHVLAPPTYLPVRELREAVDLAVDVGAKIVVAHGTHMVGPVERRDEAVIAWGLGNLTFNCDCTSEREGLLLNVDLTEVDGKAAVGEVAIIPIEAGLMDKPVRILERPSQVLDLLESLGSSEISRRKNRGYF